MTISKSILSLAFSAVLFIGCKDAAKSPDVSAATDNNQEVSVGKIETARFNIEGMSCAMGCAKTIEKKLAKLDGVQTATVDFEGKLATIKYDSSKQTVQQLAETVESAADGKTYKVSQIKNAGDKAMVFKEKDKDKKKKSKKSADKKECATDAKAAAGDKPACCAAKKSCHADEKKTM